MVGQQTDERNGISLFVRGASSGRVFCRAFETSSAEHSAPRAFRHGQLLPLRIRGCTAYQLIFGRQMADSKASEAAFDSLFVERGAAFATPAGSTSAPDFAEPHLKQIANLCHILLVIHYNASHSQAHCSS
jgi:hypothetical protein